jgi:eukaryotic-like serine/threonine-protein kinase
LAQLEELPSNPDSFQELLRTARNRFGLERRELEDFLTKVRPKIEEFASVLKVDIGTCPQFAEILAAGCGELVRLSLETANEHNQRAHESSEKNTLPQAFADPEALDATITQCTPSQRNAQNLGSSATIASPAREFFEHVGKPGYRAKIQQYDVDDLIGRGAMGIVIKARDTGLDRHVALKFLLPEMANCATAHQRFALEARFAASIRHENVVTIFSVSEAFGVPFLVMEYVPGRSLQDCLDAGEAFPAAEIARIGRQTALGLAAAHDLRLIHRDIKPANILLEQGTRCVRITDFGLARALDHDANLSQNGMLIGTPLFMSPEQVDGKPLTAATDLFSLGSVLYLLCTGKHPFESESLSRLLYAVAEKTPTPIRDINPAIPEWLAQMVAKLHAKGPADRFASAASLAEFLRAHAD